MGYRIVSNRQWKRLGLCPLRVKSRHMRCKMACPLYTRKRTCAVQLEMSAKGQTLHFALQEKQQPRPDPESSKSRNGDLQHLREMTLRSG